MSRFAVMISGIALVAGCKDSSPAGGSGSAGSGSAAVAPGSGSAPAPPVRDVREGPSLTVIDAGPDPTAVRYDDEARDDGWAPTIEADLTKRLAALPHGKLASVECRSSQCKLSITAADDSALGAATSELETALRATSAKDIVLAAPTPSGDRRGLVVYARFGR